MTSAERLFLAAFPVAFVTMWVVVTTLLSAFAGWRTLQARYPSSDEAALRTLHMASGEMGLGVHYGSCLTLSACWSGLRVSVWKIFAPFDRPFLVPWAEIRAEERPWFLGRRVRLHFGSPEAGTLTISALAWGKLLVARG